MRKHLPKLLLLAGVVMLIPGCGGERPPSGG